jgi:hypothetical protein
MRTSISFPQVAKLHNTLVEKGVTPKLLQDCLLGDGIMSDIAEAMVAETLPSRDEFRKVLGLGPIALKIVIDYSMTLADMIEAGRYDWKSDNITEKHFPHSEMGKVRWQRDVQLIHFNRIISSDDVEKELDKMGLRPGMIEELLAFGATFPETQRKFPVVALGSVAETDGGRLVTGLGMGGSGRRLYLSWRGIDRDEVCRFLALRK